MKILAISGSLRKAFTNTAMLQAVADIALPDSVLNFVDMARENDGLIISGSEFVHAIPGGLKNAIDWQASRDGTIRKPIALL